MNAIARRNRSGRSDPIRSGRGKRSERFTADVAELAAARRFVRRSLSSEVPERVVHDAQLVVSELVTNAIEHGHGDAV